MKDNITIHKESEVLTIVPFDAEIYVEICKKEGNTWCGTHLSVSDVKKLILELQKYIKEVTNG